MVGKLKFWGGKGSYAFLIENNIGFMLISSAFCLPSSQGDSDSFKLLVDSVAGKV